MKNKIVIAHISDLHFTEKTNFEEGVWLALYNELKDKETNLLAVTGDLIDNNLTGNFEKAFHQVYSFLHSIMQGMKISQLSVVPGNHDCSMLGILWSKASTKEFHKKFKEFFSPKQLSDQENNLHLSVYNFDSNKNLSPIDLASGYIDKNDLRAFADYTKTNKDWLKNNRVVLLHHHPLPIAATENRDGLDYEEFMLLRNSGQFLHEMAKAKVDLILHGHKHYPHFTKVSIPSDNYTENTIIVIGAGTVGNHSQRHPQSYNLINIMPNGEITLEKRDLIVGTTYSRGNLFKLRSYKDIRKERFNQLLEKEEILLKVRKYSRFTEILPGSGDQTLFDFYEDLQPFKTDIVSSITITVSSKSGFFCTPEYSQPGKGISVRWKWDNTFTSSTERKGSTIFDRPINKDDVISLSRSWSIYNAFWFNSQNKRTVIDDQTVETEDISTKITIFCDFISINISLPKQYNIISPRLKVLDPNEKEDIDEAKHASQGLFSFEKEGKICFSLEKPLPGYTYRIIWSLPSASFLPNITLMYVSDYINRLINSQKDPTKRLSKELKKGLETLRSSVIKAICPQEKNLDEHIEDMEVFIHALDEQLNALVCTTSIGNIGDGAEKKIENGRSTIGQAYRRLELIIWTYSPDDESSSFWKFSSNKHLVIISIPIIYLTSQDTSDGFRMGIITLASCSPTCPLLKLGKSLEIKETKEIEENRNSLIESVLDVAFDFYSLTLPHIIGVNQFP